MTNQPPALEGMSTSEVLVKHLNSLHAARRAFIETESDERIRRALRNKIRSSEAVYNNGDKVYYKRELCDRWLGPAKVVFQDDKVIFVRHGGVFVRVSPNRLMKANNVFCKTDEKPAAKTIRGEQFESSTDDGCDKNDLMLNDGDKQNNENEIREEPLHFVHDRQDTNNTKVDMKKDERIRYKIEEFNEWTDAKILNRAGKATGIHRNWYNVRNDDGLEKSINLDKVSDWETVTQDEVCVVLIPKEKHEDEKCMAAKLVELNELKEFDTYEEVPDEGQFRISTTWVLWNKGDEVRARLVARGYEDMQNYPKDSPAVGKSSMRIVLAMAVNKGWKIKTTDVKSAFLEGKELGREVYLSPPKEMKREGFIRRLKRCLYGLNDAARQFYQTVTECLINLGCIQSKLDPALFYRINNKGNLMGLLACHVDDFLHAGTEEFEKHVMKTLYTRFLIGRVEVTDFKYIGFHVIQNSHSIMLDQAEYIDNIENGIINPSRARCKTDSLTDKEQTLLRQLVGRLNWSVQGSRPDLLFDMIELSTKLKHGLVGDLMKAIKCIERIE